MFDVQDELKKLPPKPGVYIMHDERDTIIYVGKAVNLHNRVRSYFRKIVGRGPQIDQMVKQIARFEYIVTDSELEALILENNLIKEHRPKYNTMLKDDKTYPYIKVTVGEPYPRILFARRQQKDTAEGQGAIFWPLYQRAGCEEHHRAAEQDVRTEGLLQGASQGFREGEALPEPSHGALLRAVHGRGDRGGVQKARGHGAGVPLRAL